MPISKIIRNYFHKDYFCEVPNVRVVLNANCVNPRVRSPLANRSGNLRSDRSAISRERDDSKRAISRSSLAASFARKKDSRTCRLITSVLKVFEIFREESWISCQDHMTSSRTCYLPCARDRLFILFARYFLTRIGIDDGINSQPFIGTYIYLRSAINRFDYIVSNIWFK